MATPWVVGEDGVIQAAVVAAGMGDGVIEGVADFGAPSGFAPPALAAAAAAAATVAVVSGALAKLNVRCVPLYSE